MILYSYDHCPYCVKARMIFGLKSVDFELKTLLNDDEQTPISMIGKKAVPILKKEDGTFMPESMDIVTYIDQSFGDSIVEPSKKDQELDQWLKEVRKYHYALAMPRWVTMGLEEFATESARQYFIGKKQASIGPFQENVDITQDLVSFAGDHLKKLENLKAEGDYFWGDQITEDDFHVFASLRCLTTVKGFELPPKLNQYMDLMSEKSGVPLHWDMALGEDFDV